MMVNKCKTGRFKQKLQDYQCGEVTASLNPCLTSTTDIAAVKLSSRRESLYLPHDNFDLNAPMSYHKSCSFISNSPSPKTEPIHHDPTKQGFTSGRIYSSTTGDHGFSKLFNSDIEYVNEGSTINGNSKADVNKNLGNVMKRRDKLVDAPNSSPSFDKRLCSLTTIDEEEQYIGAGRRGKDARRERNCSAISPEARIQHHTRSKSLHGGRMRVDNPNFGIDSNYAVTDSVYYQEVPVSIDAECPWTVPRASSQERIADSQCEVDDEDIVYRKESDDSAFSSPSCQLNEKHWKDYSYFLDKDCDIPLHNINPAGRGKFANFRVDDVPDMDINRQLGKCSPASNKRPGFNSSRRTRLVSSESDFALHQLGQSRPGTHLSLNQRSLTSSQLSLDQVDRSRLHLSVNQVSRPGVLDENDNSEITPRRDVENTFGSRLNPKSRQHHVMSSMPDLRSQDPVWISRQAPSPYPSSSRVSLFPENKHCGQRECGNSLREQYSPHHQQIPSSPDNYLNQSTNTYYIHTNPLEALHAPFNQRQDFLTGSHNSSLLQTYPQMPLPHYLQMPLPHYPPMPLPQYPQMPLPQYPHTDPTTSIPSGQAYLHPGSSYDQQYLLECSKLSHMRIGRNSLDLGNIPNLQKQIRATSELCLEASRRHIFASSADIFKLCSGQIKPSEYLSKSASGNGCQDGIFNSVVQENTKLEAGLSVYNSPRPNVKLQLLSKYSESDRDSSSPGHVNRDTTGQFQHGRQFTMMSLPNLASSGFDRMQSQRQHQPPEICSHIDRSAFQRRGSASADLSTGRLLYQRQSSGYSSENELQQIESYAQVNKHLHKHQLDTSPPEDFLPINTSVSVDSVTGSVEDVSRAEPVYVNQSMMITQQSRDASNKSSPSGLISNMSTVLQPTTISSTNQSQSTFSPTIEKSFSLRSLQHLLSSSFNAYSRNVHRSRHMNNIPEYSNLSNNPNETSSFTSPQSTIVKHLASCPRNSRENSSVNAGRVINSDTFSAEHTRNAPYNTKRFTSLQDIPSYYGDQHMHSRTLYVKNGHYKPPNSHQKPQNSHQKPQNSHQKTQYCICDSPVKKSSSSVLISTLEAYQGSNVPFETKVISDEQGDRLSTLV